MSLKEAQTVIEQRRQHYYAVRPHDALGWSTESDGTPTSSASRAVGAQVNHEQTFKLGPLIEGYPL
jgi:Integrase core domain